LKNAPKEGKNDGAFRNSMTCCTLPRVLKIVEAPKCGCHPQ